MDRNFDHLARLLLDNSLQIGSMESSQGGFPPVPAIATHDQQRIRAAVEYARQIGLPDRGLEFQMLHGIREWYPYFVRRLAERPANLWFFLTNLLRRQG